MKTTIFHNMLKRERVNIHNHEFLYFKNTCRILNYALHYYICIYVIRIGDVGQIVKVGDFPTPQWARVMPRTLDDVM
jgi:hypothetical protein